MLPVDLECAECEIEMEVIDDYDDDEVSEDGSVVFECPECGAMTEFYEEDGETYANDIY